MNDKLLVEVQGENGAYYKAFVTDVFADEIKLAFEHDWQPESRLHRIEENCIKFALISK